MKLTINGLYSCSGSEGQVWPFQTGPFAYEVPFFAHSDLNDKLADLAKQEKPISLEIDHVYWNGVNNERIEGKVEGLYLTRRQGVEKGHRSLWYITDSRWFLQRIWTYEEFSQRRPMNEFSRVGVGAQRFFNQTPKLAYIPFTQRDGSSPDNKPRFVAGNTDPEVHELWTAHQAIVYYLTTWFDTQKPDILPDIVAWYPEVVINSTDNGYPLNGFRTNQPWPYTIAKLQRLARVRLNRDAKGRYVLSNSEEVSLNGLGGYDGAGLPQRQFKPGWKPRRVRVSFRTEKELRFNFSESMESSTIERGSRSIGLDLENVLILPQDVKETSTGKIWQRGVAVTIEKACELWNQDPENPPPRLLNGNGVNTGARVRFSVSWVRQHILSPSLATQMTFIPRLAARDDVFAARASAIYQSFRRVFRIPPVWLDVIDSMRLERTAINDPITGKRAPSPVYLDHFIEYNTRYFHYQGAGRDVKMGFNNPAWTGALRFVENFKNLPLRLASVAAFAATWVNQRQGIFKIGALPDLYGNTERVVFGTVDDAKIPVCRAGGAGAAIWQWSQMGLNDLFRMSIIISATLRTPNDHRKLYSIDFGPVSTDANGPVQEVLFGSTHAGFEWLDDNETNAKKSLVKMDGNQIEVSGGRLTNNAVIEDAANALYDQIVSDNSDRELGTFGLPGWDESRMPVGHIGSTVLVHQNGRVETIYSAEEPPQVETIWELLPQSTRNFLFRLEGNPTP